ncbi:WD40-repeat-containing domain protein [Suillus lakei]|nr:WD40-repeat-containing domain protein [Suillus lakei]
MPRDLPGLYWDEEKQRYFSLASSRRPQVAGPSTFHPPTKQQSVPQAPTGESHNLKRHRNRSLLRAREDARSSFRTTHKNKLMHQVSCSQVAQTSHVASSSILSLTHCAITAFQTVSYNNNVHSFAGDAGGWFYSSVIGPGEPVTGHTSHGWRPEFSLSSEASTQPLTISSICISGSRCIATSFGPESRILHFPLDLDSEDIRVTRVNNRSVRDIWTADFQGTRLVLGTNDQAVVIDDAADRATVCFMKTGSDVFAVAQDNNIIYTGSRAGIVQRFDSRIASTKGDRIFNDPHTTQNNSVTNLKIFYDWQLLTSNIDGSLAMFDLRFPVNRTPVVSFTGNINTYTTKTPIAVDPHEQFLFAAGQDRRIRLWSLRTGGPPLVSPASVFQKPFEDPIRALQVVEEEEGVLGLWATSGAALYKYNLGQRMEEESQAMQY